jgi:hydroxyethylthiazole kinase-like uncharacterized protein yjeF
MVGLRVAPGRHHSGEVVVVDIGIPSPVAVDAAAWLLGQGVLQEIPAKAPQLDKYRSGATLVIGGAPGLSGAVRMAAEGALRAGAGLCVAVVPEVVQPVCATSVPEVMFAPAPGAELGPPAMEEILHQAERVGAVAVGPGMGRASPTRALVGAVLQSLALPMVVDADALFHLAEDETPLAARAAPTILTPHSGEAARLLGWERERVEAERLNAATTLAERSGATVLLKGAGTVVAEPGGPLLVNGVDSPALATAGSGDVLTGILVALLAKGMTAAAAAGAGVVLHGLAGQALPGDGATARDLLSALPGVVGAR